MNDPTNWNADAEVGSFAFASPEEATKAEAVMNRALQESFENGRNVALEEAAIQAMACMNPEPYTSASQVHFDPANNMARKIAAVIRNMKRIDAARDRSSQESK